MRTYLEYYLLKEYRRMGKHTEYRILKKKIMDTLNNNKWVQVSGKLLEEDADFAADDMESDNTGLTIELQLDEMATSRENPLNKAEKLK